MVDPIGLAQISQKCLRYLIPIAINNEMVARFLESSVRRHECIYKIPRAPSRQQSSLCSMLLLKNYLTTDSVTGVNCFIPDGKGCERDDVDDGMPDC